jgi:ankyrin repeat protein
MAASASSEADTRFEKWVAKQHVEAAERKRLLDLEPAQERFFHAVDFGQVDEVEAFLANPGEVDVNYTRGRYYPALHNAVMRGHERIVQTLLEHGADVSAVDAQNDTALHTAICSPNHKRYERIVLALLLHGADVNTHGRGGKTPMHFAVRFKSSVIVKILLHHGADISRRDDDGFNALHAVVLRTHGSTAGQNKICRMFLDNGSDVRFKLAVLLQKSNSDDEIPGLDQIPSLMADTMEKYDMVDMMIDAEDQCVEQIKSVESADLAREAARRCANKTAFAMGHHARLGANSLVTSLAPEMLEMILRHV